MRRCDDVMARRPTICARDPPDRDDVDDRDSETFLVVDAREQPPHSCGPQMMFAHHGEGSGVL